MSSRKPLIVGIGGTTRIGSSTERALGVALRAIEAGGGEGRLLGGEFLARLPIYNPAAAEPTAEQTASLEDLRERLEDEQGTVDRLQRKRDRRG